jgi:hypothetical protein
MGVGGQHDTLAAISLGKRPITHCLGGWVGLWDSLDWCGKSHPPLGFDPQTAHPVASPFINYTIPAHMFSSWPDYLLFVLTNSSPCE